MRSRIPVAGCVLLLGLLSARGAAAEKPMPMPMPPGDPQAPTPAKAPGTIPPERPIFVPIWTEPVESGKEAPASARRARVDFVWTGVTLPAGRMEASIKPDKGTATLLELRPLAPMMPSHRRDFSAVVRVKSDRAAATPFLELVDSATLLQSRAWGRLRRRTADGAEWVFVLPDPVPLPLGQPNPVSAQVKAITTPPRTFELRLVADASIR